LRAVADARGTLLALALLVVVALAGCGGPPDVEIDQHESAGAQVSWGEPADEDPAGVVMLLHGGGWKPDPAAYALQRDVAAPGLQDDGYATVAVGYDEGAKGFRQIQDVYAQARKRYPDLPICAVGISAGGNLALMLATREPKLDCVVTFAAPTDLTTLAKQDPQADEAYQGAVEVFGKDGLERFSPVRYAKRIHARVLMIAAETDPIVPAAQSRELAQALPSSELLVLPSGPAPSDLAHSGGVEADAQEAAVERELAFLAEATQNG
jgi:pimeloyl-ACP methyl ester carboxylesterase